RRSAAPPPSPSAAAFPRRGAERLQRHQRPSRRRATGKPVTLDVERPGARLRRSAAPPPSPSAAAFPRRGAERLQRHQRPSRRRATGKPVTLDVERPGARLRRSAAPPPSPSAAAFPRRGAERLQRHQRPSRRRAPGNPVTLDVERPGARLRRAAAPPPSPSAAAFPRRGAERLQRHQRRVQTTVKPLRTLLRGLWVQNQFPKPDTSACHSGPLVEPALPYRAVGSAGSPASAWGVRMTAAASPVWPLMGSPIGSPVASPTRCSLRHSIAFLAFSGEHRNAILIRFTDDVSVSSPDRISESSS